MRLHLLELPFMDIACLDRLLDCIRYCTVVKIQEENLTHRLMVKCNDSKNE